MENNLQKNKTKSLCCILEMQHGKLTMLQLKNKILIRNNFGEKSQRNNQKVISN